jgi:single-strand DNA-binding protein
MTIPTQMSLAGFIATTPQLNFTGNGVARFHARAGVEHFRRNDDGSFAKLDSTFHDLVAYGKTAERAYSRFRVGDSFVASGYIEEFEVDHNGTTETREQFVARRIGHDTARTRYQIDRTPARQPDPPSPDLHVVKDRSPAVGI